MTNSKNTLTMTLKTGIVTIILLEDIAPKHVARIKELVTSGFYNGLKFHRVIDGFIAQTGCPNSDGTGRTDQTLDAEFSDTEFKKGVVAMARGVDINSADSQFFICLENYSKLKGKYTIWGEVIEGMEHIATIEKGASDTGKVTNPDVIIKMELT